MNASPLCKHIVEALMTNHEFALDSMSPGNSEIIAYMLAGSICHAKKKITGHESLDATQDELLTVAVNILCGHTSSHLEIINNIPHTINFKLATMAVIRYRECATPALGGNQTPCTVCATEKQTNGPESLESSGQSMISKMISTICKMLKRVAPILRISTISGDIK
ncbi:MULTISPECIES: hypothetical protein [Aeromonas]|uniref:hypothetical protein n=1 Tax=Aeromonas TaxID=642 RepID=UPI000F78F53B|nr:MULTISPECIES: hypothetical protein [Aeromonas]MDX7595487.1 hypothetical protein [Aeromonas caviae]